MPKVILHIGLHKTGTSAIQQVMRAAAPELLDNRYRVVEGMNKTSGHAEFVQAFREGRSEDAMSGLELERSRYPDSDLILSSENFSFLNPSGIRSLWDVVHRVGDPIVVVYLRRQDQWLESIYRQRVCHYLGRETHSIKEVSKRVETDFYSRLKNWSNVFGVSALRVRVYGQVARDGGHLTKDFIRTIGVRTPESLADSLHGRTVNRSLPVELVACLRLINRSEMPQAVHKKLVDYLRENSEKYPTDSKAKYFLTPEERYQMVRDHQSLNQKIAQTYSLDEYGTHELCESLPDRHQDWVSPNRNVSKLLARLVSELWLHRDVERN